jgi:hypothetical protein
MRGDLMHATIWCDTPTEGTSDARALSGRALTIRLRALPGFVAYVALAVEGGGTAAICICEDAESLTAANGLIAEWGAGDHTGRDVGAARTRTGAVILQTGL